MDLGVTLGFAEAPLNRQLRLAAELERAGAASIACLEAGYDVFTLLGGVSGVTHDLTLTSAVATWVRPPVATARAALTLDELSGGRFVLGLGTMPPAWNRDHFGIHTDRPLSRMREYVAAVRGVFSAYDQPLDFTGEHFRISGFRLPRRPPRAEIPILLGATRPRMATMAAEVADGVLFNFVCTPAWLDGVLLPAVAAGERSRGRRVRRELTVCCSISDDIGEARAWVRSSLSRHLAVPYFYQVAEHSGFDLTETRQLARADRTREALAAIPDGLLDTMAVCGDPRTAMEALDRLAGTLDGIHLMPPRHLPPEVASRALAGVTRLVHETGHATRTR